MITPIRQTSALNHNSRVTNTIVSTAPNHKPVDSAHTLRLPDRPLIAQAHR